MEDTTLWTRLPTIEAGRVFLRWLEDGDVPALFEIFSRPDVTRYWSSPAFRELAQAQELLDSIQTKFADRSVFQWGVVHRELGRVVGTCTLHQVDLEQGRAELGFALHRDHWGRGLMREAVTTLIDFAFARLGLRRLEADADPRNERSIVLLENLGFVREGYLRERWCVAGEIQDAAFYGLLAREWINPSSAV